MTYVIDIPTMLLQIVVTNHKYDMDTLKLISILIHKNNFVY